MTDRITRQSINGERQGKPSLIARDIVKLSGSEHHGGLGRVSEDAVLEVLLRRGVFKWLSIRLYLSQLQRVIVRRMNVDRRALGEARQERRSMVKAMTALGVKFRGFPRRASESPASAFHRGYLKGRATVYAEMLEEVRDICNSDRWQAPYNDQMACKWLEVYADPSQEWDQSLWDAPNESCPASRFDGEWDDGDSE